MMRRCAGVYSSSAAGGLVTMVMTPGVARNSTFVAGLEARAPSDAFRYHELGFVFENYGHKLKKLYRREVRLDFALEA